jgi:hypothetical protein
MPLKTLFLNPPSFENFDGGAGSRWPATREIESYWYPVWLAYPRGCSKGRGCWMVRRTTSQVIETVAMAKDTSFWCCSLRRPGFLATSGWRGLMKEVNPKIKIAFCRSARDVLPEKSLRDCPRRLISWCASEFDTSVVQYAKGKPLSELPGVVLQRWRSGAQSRSSADSGSGRTAPCHRRSTSAISTSRITTCRSC